MAVVRSGGACPKLFPLGNDTSVAAFGEPVQGQLQTARTEFRIFCDAMSFVKKNDGAGFGLPQDSFGRQPWFALDRIQPPDRPTDQGKSASPQFGVDKQILQPCRCPKHPRRAIWRAAEQFRAAIYFRRDSRWTGRP